MFTLFYKKNNNCKLFEHLEENGFQNVQNYFPLLSNFFKLEDNNYNKINLNQKYSINLIQATENNNNFTLSCQDENSNDHIYKSFFKFSPLIDPVKFMVGKYEKINKSIIETLPKLKDNGCLDKVMDKNNSAYVDGFFSYLTSQLLHHHSFSNGLDFYGTFTAVQNKYVCDIFEDLEYLHDAKFFHRNKDILFEVDHIDTERLLESDTRKYRKKIQIDKSKVDLQTDTLNNDMFEGVFELTHDNINKHNNELDDEVWKSESSEVKSEKSHKKTNSTCSSRSSNTDGEEEELGDSEDESDFSEYSSEEEEVIHAYINDFPVQIICLEKMENTLDYLMETKGKHLNNKEWKSCLFQIIMMLITYQKVFDFTHNDLHTNNIMWNKTDKKFINYKYNNVYYKVPTFGKLYKIIDFGRAIYKFQDKIICSDSYHPKGDAATQYNTEPYFDAKKPRLEPNKSFDLCRLGCSLFDYFMNDEEDEDHIENPVAKVINEWITDDKNRNILYKNNGEERYPDFKLYKMIARTVHNHTPQKEIDHIFFSNYRTNKKKMKKQKVMNIDEYPIMFKTHVS
jgi:hypothetical protein